MAGNSCSVFAAGAVFVIAGQALAQPFLDFRDVPIISTQSPETFRNLFSRGHCSTVRAVLLGDSQETCPNGLGSVYIPRLHYELFLRYGNSPETPLMGTLAHNGGGTPWATWLLRNSNAGPGLTATRIPDNAMPPQLTSGKSSLNNGNNVNNNQWYGALYMLQHRADHIDPGALVNGSQDFFKRGDGVYMDVFAATNPSSGEIVARVTPHNAPAPNYHQPTVATIPVNMGLESETFEIKHQRIGPLPFNGRSHMQVELFGSRADKFTDIIGARYVSSVDSRGWAISSFASGGYQTHYIQQTHGQSGGIIAALEPDVLMLAFGANDFGQGMSPVQFKTNTLALISYLRDAVGSETPVILLADPDRSFVGSPAGSGANSDLLAGVLHDIAQSTPRVCAVNSRLLTDQQGWSRLGDFTPYVSDAVHYTPLGARLKAQLEVDALYSSFGTRCYADLDDGSGIGRPDCGVDINDLLYFLVAFEAGASPADLDDDGDPSSSNPDEAVDINDLLFYLARFEAGC